MGVRLKPNSDHRWDGPHRTLISKTKCSSVPKKGPFVNMCPPTEADACPQMEGSISYRDRVRIQQSQPSVRRLIPLIWNLKERDWTGRAPLPCPLLELSVERWKGPLKWIIRAMNHTRFLGGGV